MRKTTVVTLTVAIVMVPLLTMSAQSFAAYSALGAGHSADGAATLLVPPSPTITSTTSVLGTSCLIGLSWTAPPNGEEYTLTRTVGTTATVIGSPHTAAGTTTDTVSLSGLSGNAPVYPIKANWVADTLWSAGPSVGATASGCLSLL